MKIKKFKKTKILFTAILLCILVLSSIMSVFAFEFRTPDNTMYTQSSPPSLEELQYIISTVTLQLEMNMADRGQYFIAVYYDPDTDTMQAVIANSQEGITVTQNASVVTLHFPQTAYRYGWSSTTGFYELNSGSSFDMYILYVYYSFVTIPSYGSQPSFTGQNLNVTYGTGNFNAASVYNYYKYIYDSVVNREERESTLQEEAESIGYENGYNEGHRVGFDEGRDIGYNEGYTYGYEVGYNKGFTDGKEAGYDIGYDSGRNEGYREGYDEGYELGYQFGEDHGYQEGQQDGISAGYQNGYNIGFNEGRQEGYDIGYGQGYEDGQAHPVYKDAYELDIGEIFSGVSSVPKNIINTVFDINLFGINVAGFLGSILIVVIVAFVIKKVKG